MARDFEKGHLMGEDGDWGLMVLSSTESTHLTDSALLEVVGLLSAVQSHSSFLAWPVCYVLNQLWAVESSSAHSLAMSHQFLDYAPVTLNLAADDQGRSLCESVK